MVKRRSSRKKRTPKVDDYRHEEAKRKNNPPAKIAAEGTIPAIPKAEYAYNPHLPPVLRFDPTGAPDELPYLLEEARQRALDDEEVKVLTEALRNQEPWLEWAGKREQKSFEVDPVALHIHERISTQAILKVAARQDIERGLFADPEQEYHEAVQFYKHNIDWTNRLILGDSLQVMSSLARREDLAGKVQMIYMDPPYGIKFASNFQSLIGKRHVYDKESDLTREPEMVKAYRDTWHMGIHSYLSYLRDRLVVAKELLADSGSIFIQIGDENLHSVRDLMDSVFDRNNMVSVVTFKKTGGLGTTLLKGVGDYLLWYARDKSVIKYRQLYLDKQEMDISSAFTTVDCYGYCRPATEDEINDPSSLPQGATLVRTQDLASSGRTPSCVFDFELNGMNYSPFRGRSWKTNLEGMKRLAGADRLNPGNTLRFIIKASDYPVAELTNFWSDTGGASDRVYVVQTATKVVERCMLMTTDPGDLVLDPTCGSGSTAYVAECWGRRWITIDTSRVSIAIARQRLLTARFEYYKLKDEFNSVSGGFKYKTVPHVKLKSIAQNTNLDPIFDKHGTILQEKLGKCNKALGKVTKEIRQKLDTKLVAKERREGKRSVTDADRRRWELPGEKFEHWTVPFDTDSDWPKELIEAVKEYRVAWRAKMDEVNACIAANTEQEELVDQPEIVRGVVRVSGPFTVEAVQPPEISLGDLGPESEAGMFAGEPEEMETFGSGQQRPIFAGRPVETRADKEAQNLDAYLDKMLRLLKSDGVRFPNNKQMKFTRLEPISGGESGLHAEGRWILEGEQDDDTEGKATVCVAFGPQYGPVTAMQVEELVRSANRRGYDDLVVAAFSFDGPAQAVIEEAQHPHLRIHMAHIRPDVNPGMEGLLKEQPGSQLFTVFGQPRTKVKGPDKNGEYRVIMEGVDIYNPVDNSIKPTGADKVAAWFVDGDYDGWTFCITQAFFPDKSAWEKLSKALKTIVDTERFEAFSGTESLPFPAGKHKCVAVKVIDPRGNEVMRVHKLGD